MLIHSFMYVTFEVMHIDSLNSCIILKINVQLSQFSVIKICTRLNLEHVFMTKCKRGIDIVIKIHLLLKLTCLHDETDTLVLINC